MKKPKRNYRRTAGVALLAIATCVLCSAFLWKVIEGSMNYRGNVKTNSDPQAKPRGCETFHGGSGCVIARATATATQAGVSRVRGA